MRRWWRLCDLFLPPDLRADGESDFPFKSVHEEALSHPESGEGEEGAYSLRHSITRHTFGERNGRTCSKVVGSSEKNSIKE